MRNDQIPHGPAPMPVRRRVAAIGLSAGMAVGLFVSGCAAPTEDSASAGDSSAATEAALAALDADTRTLVEFEAAWQCDLTRFAFTDLSEIDTLRAELQEAQGVTDEEYDAFVTRLETEPELASLVAELNNDCGGNDLELEGPVSL